MKNKKIYNIIFPIWFLILVPVIWLIAVPLNFIIDSIVVILTLKIMKIEEYKEIFKKSIFKVFIFGFLADIIGAGVLTIPMLIGTNDEIIQGINWDPYTNISSVIIIFIATLLSGIIIYLLNRLYSFNLPHVTEKNKKKIALIIAIFTLPYMFFVPTKVLYNNYVDNTQGNLVEQNNYEYVSTYDEYLNTYDNVYLKDNSEMVELTDAAKNVVGSEPFSTIKTVSYEIDNESNIFVVNYTLDEFDQNNIDEYNKWSEKIALLVVESTANVNEVEFNIVANNDITLQTIYNKEYFEYKYSTSFEDILNNTEYIESIINQ